MYLKYLIMKVRAKISFIAFQKRMTILELLLFQILQSYLILRKEQGLNEFDVLLDQQQNEMIDDFVDKRPYIIQFIKEAGRFH